MNGRSMEDFLQFIERIDASKGGHVSPSAGIGQNFSDAVRPVFFMTDFEEFLYATHGGTLFLVEYEGRIYGLTCQHVFKDFPRERLFVANEKFAQKGSKPAPIKGFYNPSQPREGAVDTDITDLCMIEFSAEVTAGYFGGAAYVFNDNTIATAREGNALVVSGVLKEKTEILSPDIKFGYCRLEFQDAGVGSSDPFLREAIAEFPNPGFSSIVGISGAPLFDRVQERLCGMVMRGGMSGRRCSLLYLDVADIAQSLKAVRAGAGSTYYTKGVLMREDRVRRNFLADGSLE